MKVFTPSGLIINDCGTSVIIGFSSWVREINVLGGLISVDNELLIVHIRNFNLDKLRLLKLNLLYLSPNGVPRPRRKTKDGY